MQTTIYQRNKAVNNARRDSILAVVYFLLSLTITWWFIVTATHLYYGQDKMLLSCLIAGAKWGIQIVAAAYWLGDIKWIFVRRIGFTCALGSCILLPYILLHTWLGSAFFFAASIAGAVIAMVCTYYHSVKQTGLSMRWFWGWLACLVIAICLQVVYVFGV